MGREDLRDCMLNDPVHVAGVHGRLRQSIWNYKCRGQDLVSLWSDSITAIGDIFANLGRATARLQFVENSQEALARLVALPNGAARWKPVIERLYSGTSAPWRQAVLRLGSRTIPGNSGDSGVGI